MGRVPTQQFITVTADRMEVAVAVVARKAAAHKAVAEIDRMVVEVDRMVVEADRTAAVVVRKAAAHTVVVDRRVDTVAHRVLVAWLHDTQLFVGY